MPGQAHLSKPMTKSRFSCTSVGRLPGRRRPAGRYGDMFIEHDHSVRGAGCHQRRRHSRQHGYLYSTTARSMKAKTTTSSGASLGEVGDVPEGFVPGIVRWQQPVRKSNEMVPSTISCRRLPYADDTNRAAYGRNQLVLSRRGHRPARTTSHLLMARSPGDIGGSIPSRSSRHPVTRPHMESTRRVPRARDIRPSSTSPAIRARR